MEDKERDKGGAGEWGQGSQGFPLKPSGHYQCVTIQNVKDRIEAHRELPEGTVKFPQLIGRKLFCHWPPGSFSNMKEEMGVGEIVED